MKRLDMSDFFACAVSAGKIGWLCSRSMTVERSESTKYYSSADGDDGDW